MKRKINLSNLPKIGTNIDWKNSVGCNVNFEYDDVIGSIEIAEYSAGYLSIYYNHAKYRILASSLKKCALGKVVGKITSEFKYNISDTILNDKDDFTIIDRKRTYKKTSSGKVAAKKTYKFYCNKCGYNDGWIIEGNIVAGYGCPCCCPNPQKVVVGINDIPTTASWMVKFFQGGSEEAKNYTKCSAKKVYFVCPTCNQKKTKKMAIGTLYQNGHVSCICSKTTSFPQRFMYSILSQFNIDFQSEVTFEWCNFYSAYKNKIVHGRYDFVLPSNKIIIEMDGSFHGTDNLLSGQSKEESTFIDKMKDKLANDIGWIVIRINCKSSNFDFIKSNLLKSELSNYIDFSIVNWDCCREYLPSSFVKDICDYYRLNKCSTTDVINKFNISRTSAIKHLKTGSELGWCNYNPKEEIRKSADLVKKFNEKSIALYKDGVFMSAYRSASELCEQCLQQFNVDFKVDCVRRVARGDYKSHKGFQFLYLSE